MVRLAYGLPALLAVAVFLPHQNVRAAQEQTNSSSSVLEA